MKIKYSFHAKDVHLDRVHGLSSERAGQLAEEIFKAWSANLTTSKTSKNALRLRAELTDCLDGKSTAEVYKLIFRKAAKPNNPVARFIIRMHTGENAKQQAQEERELVRILHTQGSDFFSSALIEPLPSIPDVVVYRHADDQLGHTSLLFSDQLLSLLESPEDDKISNFSKSLFATLVGLTNIYESLKQERRLITGSVYYDTIRSRLPPDLIIDASDREILIERQIIKVLTENNDGPGDLTRVESVDADTLLENLADAESISKWLRVQVWPQSLRKTPAGYIRFESGDIVIWLRLASDIQVRINPTKTNEIIVKSHDFNPGIQILDNIEFPQDSCLSALDFKELCETFGEEIEQAPRHTDLHSKNILVGNLNRMKLIDLGSLASDLPSVGHARLEVSIWAEVTAAYTLSNEEVSWILDNLSKLNEPKPDEMSHRGRALYTVLLALRRSLGSTDESQVALSYVTQILLFQRYFLESHTRCQPAFAQLCAFWMHRFQDTIRESLTRNLERSKKAPTSQKMTTLLEGPQDGYPTLYSLWESAVYQPRIPMVKPRSRLFLSRLLETNKILLNYSLTSFQKTLWDSRQELRPFQSDRNVIISAPTSSGKSTVAELFLAGPPLLNNERKCSLYVAPTRALTQAKFNDLKRTFLSDTEMAEGVVLSTGEDTDDDWRIVHGLFSLACMVYEKANILFSQNQKLLDQLGCVVIDEVHMLTDLERGPILELMLTKALWERNRIDSESGRRPNRETIRIIAISTEDTPDQPMVDFLSVLDPQSGSYHAPLIFQDGQRPVPVRHTLVLQGVDSPYTLSPIVEFKSSSNRTLSSTELAEIGTQLLSKRRQRRYHRKRGRHSVMNELTARLNLLLQNLLNDNPRGYRVLVFLPSRNATEQEARRLKNQLSKRASGSRMDRLGQKLSNEKLLLDLKPHLDNAEDQRMAKVVRECASAGIFIHHSDIDKKIRHEIEKVCSTMPPTAPSQVIFATETLSYGVNLAVHDVVLVGTKFHSQSRHREPRTEPLSACAYHNMCGRAGRLGKTGNNVAHVFILVPYEDEAYGVLEDYYASVPNAMSRLYVTDDRAVQLKAEANPFGVLLEGEKDECSRYRSLGAADFSYPFVRSVLDALRHLNRAGLSVSRGSMVPITCEQLLQLFGSTLYAKQFLGQTSRPREAVLFRCAVQRILDDCAKTPLKLVEANYGKTPLYSITERGEAIIDTGTEIQTVEPLLSLSELTRDTWKTLMPSEPLPTDLYILCIVAQNEIYRQYIYYSPECRGRSRKNWPKQMAEANRRNVLKAFVKAIMRVEALSEEEARSLAESLRALLDDWESIQKIDAGYSYGASDSLLRYFTGIIAWINGDDRSDVDDLLEGRELPEAYRGRIQGFRQFTEKLQIKTLFLSKMLVTDTTGEVVLTPEDERNLHLLATRLRLGCTALAIPLFWPFSSDFRRKEAAKLLKGGLTPSRLLSVADPTSLASRTVDIAPKRLEVLMADLEKYAKKEFAELQEEITSVPAPDLKRETVHRLCNEMVYRFQESVSDFRGNAPTGDPQSSDFDGLIRERLDLKRLRAEDEKLYNIDALGSVGRAAVDQYFRIRVKVDPEEIGLDWIGERIFKPKHTGDGPPTKNVHLTGGRPNYRKEQLARIIGVSFRKDLEM